MERTKSLNQEHLSDVEDLKQPDFEGYEEYKNRINLSKLMAVSYTFDPLKHAIDDLYEKCYNNQMDNMNLAKENQTLRDDLYNLRDKIYHQDEKLVIADSKIKGIDPESYSFPEIFKILHDFLAKI